MVRYVLKDILLLYGSRVVVLWKSPEVKPTKLIRRNHSRSVLKRKTKDECTLRGLRYVGELY